MVWRPCCLQTNCLLQRQSWCSALFHLGLQRCAYKSPRLHFCKMEANANNRTTISPRTIHDSKLSPIRSTRHFGPSAGNPESNLHATRSNDGLAGYWCIRINDLLLSMCLMDAFGGSPSRFNLPLHGVFRNTRPQAMEGDRPRSPHWWAWRGQGRVAAPASFQYFPEPRQIPAP